MIACAPLEMRRQVGDWKYHEGCIGPERFRGCPEMIMPKDVCPCTQIEVDFDTSLDKSNAGNGLRSFPLLNKALHKDQLLDWQMSPSERVALIFLLEHLKPKVAIEIGTRFGGSLQVLSSFCEHVYSIDIDPDVPRRLWGRFLNVEYLTGPSDQILPALLNRLQHENAELSFALVDGDHSTEGVRKDIENLLRYRPRVPFYVVMHDSFNPQCRQGLRQANWSANRYVHAVELDFVAGAINSAPEWRDQLWGGLAMAILLPFERRADLNITGRAQRTYNACMASMRSPLKQFAQDLAQMARWCSGQVEKRFKSGS